MGPGDRPVLWPIVPGDFRPLGFGRNIQGLALVDDMDGEKLECFVAGHRERAVRNVANVDFGGARLEHDRLAVGRDGGGAAYDVNGLFAGMRGSVSLITYVGSNVAMLPRSKPLSRSIAPRRSGMLDQKALKASTGDAVKRHHPISFMVLLTCFVTCLVSEHAAAQGPLDGKTAPQASSPSDRS